jgi:hypothetical protein
MSDIENAKYLITEFIKCPNDYHKIITLSEKFSLDDFVKQTCKRYSIKFSDLSLKRITCRVISEKYIKNQQLYNSIIKKN